MQGLPANLTSGGMIIPTTVPHSGLESFKGTVPLCEDGTDVPRWTTATFPRSPGCNAVAMLRDLVKSHAVGFIVTPSGTTPSVTNCHTAINSLRASATTITLQMRSSKRAGDDRGSQHQDWQSAAPCLCLAMDWRRILDDKEQARTTQS